MTARSVLWGTRGIPLEGLFTLPSALYRVSPWFVLVNASYNVTVTSVTETLHPVLLPAQETLKEQETDHRPILCWQTSPLPLGRDPLQDGLLTHQPTKGAVIGAGAVMYSDEGDSARSSFVTVNLPCPCLQGSPRLLLACSVSSAAAAAAASHVLPPSPPTHSLYSCRSCLHIKLVLHTTFPPLYWGRPG